MRTFPQVLGDLPGGRTVDELSEALAQLVLAVAATGKKGSITLKLDVAPNADDMVSIDDTITLKLPQRARGRAIFFHDAEGSLLKENPRQGKLALREVSSAPTEPPRRVKTSSGVTIDGVTIIGPDAEAVANAIEAAG